MLRTCSVANIEQFKLNPNWLRVEFYHIILKIIMYIYYLVFIKYHQNNMKYVLFLVDIKEP